MMRRLTVVALALWLPACSLVWMKRPPAKKAVGAEYPECHTSPAAPLGDLTFTALLGLSAVTALRDESSSHDKNNALVTALFAAAFFASAVYGFSNVSKCADARKAWKKRGAFSFQPSESAPRRKPRTQGGAGGACFPNETCEPGFYCDPNIKLCRPGHKGLEGGECLPGAVCRGDLTCSAGICTKPPEPECVSDEHCPSGQSCQDGFCLESAN